MQPGHLRKPNQPECKPSQIILLYMESSWRAVFPKDFDEPVKQKDKSIIPNNLLINKGIIMFSDTLGKPYKTCYVILDEILINHIPLL